MVEFVDRKGKDKNPSKKTPAMKKSPIQTVCKHCDHTFSVAAAHAGSDMPCPKCSETTPIEAVKEMPKAVEATQTATLRAPRKRTTTPTPLKKPPPKADTGPQSNASSSAGETPEPEQGALDPAREPDPQDPPVGQKAPPKKSALKTKPKCPECGASMDKDAIICVHCGHDPRNLEPTTKPTMVTEQKKGFPIIPILVACILIAGAAYYFAVMRNNPGTTPPRPTNSPTVGQSAARPTPDPVVLPEPVETPEPEPEPAPVVVETQVPTGESTETDLRQQIVDRLDARQPLVESGDTVQLAGQDGVVYRGKIIEINDTSVRLYYRGSEGEVPIRSLSPRSRSQIDPVFREQLIDSLVERYQDPGKE